VKKHVGGASLHNALGDRDTSGVNELFDASQFNKPKQALYKGTIVVTGGMNINFLRRFRQMMPYGIHDVEPNTSKTLCSVKAIYTIETSI
jgi:hypothetical protein